jgi:hypothetical protein
MRSWVLPEVLSEYALMKPILKTSALKNGGKYLPDLVRCKNDTHSPLQDGLNGWLCGSPLVQVWFWHPCVASTFKIASCGRYGAGRVKKSPRRLKGYTADGLAGGVPAVRHFVGMNCFRKVTFGFSSFGCLAVSSTAMIASALMSVSQIKCRAMSTLLLFLTQWSRTLPCRARSFIRA